MSIIRAVKGFFQSDEQVVQLYNCDGCSNVFTKTWAPGEQPSADVACPNCGSSDVEMAVETS